MNKNDIIPYVKPHKMPEYEFQQSKYDVAPIMPFSQIIVAPSGSGKTIFLQNMILDTKTAVVLNAFLYGAHQSILTVYGWK